MNCVCQLIMNYTLLKLIRVVVFFRKNDKQLENACITGDPRWGGGFLSHLSNWWTTWKQSEQKWSLSSDMVAHSKGWDVVSCIQIGLSHSWVAGGQLLYMTRRIVLWSWKVLVILQSNHIQFGLGLSAGWPDLITISLRSFKILLQCQYNLQTSLVSYPNRHRLFSACSKWSRSSPIWAEQSRSNRTSVLPNRTWIRPLFSITHDH